ncbi:hypothetical protein SAMN05216267_10617 [Actinacidiphila rubida]|uniref:Lipoprotein n=1 Tax=Actinacidiphila rubida TaxID=310780 RepID=A0A1H8TYP0_9ACTN|nr:hypothetical protein [Actinacidiphila rubida]SEO96109.1 hypothetical protein SAMN05216267_10617 [Actinacidiphila rubida]
MRAARISAAVLLAVPVLAVTVPAAAGDSVTAPGELGGPVASFGFTVTPSTVAPGDTVTLRATGCAAPATAAASDLFATVPLGVHQGHGQSAQVTVRSDARPGVRYDVAFTCGTEEGSTPLTIGPRAAVSPSPAPRAAAHTGLGGAVSGPGAVEVALGAALVGAAGVLIFRRARTPHR